MLCYCNHNLRIHDIETIHGITIRTINGQLKATALRGHPGTFTKPYEIINPSIVHPLKPGVQYVLHYYSDPKNPKKVEEARLTYITGLLPGDIFGFDAFVFGKYPIHEPIWYGFE
jgi:hypothetical protein